jgi:hypothetical protein
LKLSLVAPGGYPLQSLGFLEFFVTALWELSCPEIHRYWFTELSRYQASAHNLLDSRQGEDLEMIRQPIFGLQRPDASDTIQLAHIDSELCWCDPIVKYDEKGQQTMIHNEVTWN